jgi:hypothetical protein
MSYRTRDPVILQSQKQIHCQLIRCLIFQTTTCNDGLNFLDSVPLRGFVLEEETATRTVTSKGFYALIFFLVVVVRIEVM